MVFIGAKSSWLTADIPEDHSSILVHSSCSDAELAEWYQHASCVVSLSEYEGFNLPVAEAISMGCRVVCSDIPVHRELYADRVDFVIRLICPKFPELYFDVCKMENRRRI
ncbi:MAG: glycosyltransferase [Bacteroidota bacterium]|nr:MAG: glycosyltransferase [Bacteroidota bacterium]